MRRLHRGGGWRRRALLAAAQALVAAPAAPVAHAAGLPPAPGPAAPGPLAMTLYLELVVNQQPSGQVVPVQLRGGHYHIAAEVLRPLHVRAPPPGADGLVAVDLIEGVKTEYDSIGQRLLIMVPPDWLPAQQIGSDRPLAFGTPLGGRGLLVNYDLYASNLGRPGAYASLWNEQRVFGDWGVFSNTGVYRHTLSASVDPAATPADSGYLRYDTRWTYADPERVRVTTVGDLITGSLSWGSSVRLGGLQVARNFAIRPDLVPYPLPRFSGQAAVPSAVDLFINGYKAGSEPVQPGPFTLNTVPYINGAGEASVVTTDALGRQVLTTVPFYVANTLLKPGNTDYAFAAGALRRSYGIRNFAYGRTATSAAYRWGASDTLTLEGRAEAAHGLALAGAGAVVALGRLGVANASFSTSRGEADRGLASGRQWTLGYQYNAPQFGVGAQQTLRSPGYGDLSTLEASDFRLARRSTQVSGSASLGEAGALSAIYLDVRAADGQRTRLATLSYSRAVGARSFLSVNYTRAVGGPDHTLQLQWTLLLDTAGSISVATTRDRQSSSQQVQYSRNPPPAGGLGWNVGYATGATGDYRQASATWRSSQAQVQAGVYAQGNQNTTWAGASGAVVAMDGGVFLANRINDAFALVSTSGVADVPVRFENQVIGHTDAAGHLLVTGVNAYYPARFEIDTLDLPIFMQAPQPERRLVLRSGSGALVRFEITQVLAASIALVDGRGRPLPPGLLARHAASGRTAVVGWDGLVYFEGLQRENELLVTGPDFAPCRVRFALDAAKPQVLRVGPLTCESLPTLADTRRWLGTTLGTTPLFALLPGSPP